MFFTKLQNLSKTQLGYLFGFLAESSFFRKNKNSGSVDFTASRDVEHRRFEVIDNSILNTWLYRLKSISKHHQTYPFSGVIQRRIILFYMPFIV